MPNITSISELKTAILQLEAELEIKGQLLKDEVYLTYDSLKPVNMLRKSLHDLVTSPNLVEDILGAALGLTSGFLSKQLIVGKSSALLRKLLGSILQFAVTNLIAQHPDAIKSAGQYIVDHFFRKKDMNSTNP